MIARWWCECSPAHTALIIKSWMEKNEIHLMSSSLMDKEFKVCINLLETRGNLEFQPKFATIKIDKGKILKTHLEAF